MRRRRKAEEGRGGTKRSPATTTTTKLQTLSDSIYLPPLSLSLPLPRSFVLVTCSTDARSKGGEEDPASLCEFPAFFFLLALSSV